MLFDEKSFVVWKIEKTGIVYLLRIRNQFLHWLSQRTKMHLREKAIERYNDRLENVCEEHNIGVDQLHEISCIPGHK